MANLKEIRGRITSISSTMQITSAMKMVSAAKLKKATDAIVMLRPYSEKLQEIIENVSSTTDLEEVGTYTAEREVKKVLFIVVTSNKGLAGAFNSSVIKELDHAISNTKHEVEILSVGKKVYEAIRKNRTVYDNQSAIFDSMSFEAVSNFMEHVMKDYREGKFDKDFVDKETFAKQKEEGVTRKLVGFEMQERAIPRHDYPVVDTDGNVIGKVTSGTMSPMRNVGIGLAYVAKPHFKVGSDIFIQIRNKSVPAKVVKTPFV